MAALAALVLCACGKEGVVVTRTDASVAAPTAKIATPAATATAVVAPTPRPTVSRVTVPYRVEVRVPDADDFRSILAATMADRRGWTRAGFDVVESEGAPYRVVLAEGDEVDRLCRPYETGGEFSCQNGPIVAINAERWRDGVAHWPGTVASYRTMLLNHEMGHLLGQRHRDCPKAGALAPVMQQQSGGLDGCKANAWPLSDEIARAARHDLKLAPAYGE